MRTPLIALSVFACQTQVSPISQAIVGGSPAAPTAYPWMAELVRAQATGGRHKCGGAFIDATHVVTAAHCVIGSRRSSVPHAPERYVLEPATLEVLARPELRQGTRDDVRYAVARIDVHPGYDDETVGFDLALLTLAAPARLPSYATLATTDDVARLTPNSSLTVLGYGQTETGQLSDDLLYATLRYVPQATCQAAYPHAAVGPSQLCAGDPENIEDACGGDSGGPLIKSNTSTLVGVVSFGRGCSETYGVYTNVAQARAWLAACMAGSCETFQPRTQCESLYADCDGNPANGCEASLRQATRCGTCNQRCASGETCDVIDGGAAMVAVCE